MVESFESHLHDRLAALELERRNLRRDSEDWRRCNAMIGQLQAVIYDYEQSQEADNA